MTSDHGVTEPYDRLVIATGSVPFIIPVPGKDLPGVLTYRDLDDVNAMLLAAQSRAKAVVIGGGLLGLEAAAGLNERGMDVTVLHVMPTLMERQLDPAAGYLLQKAVEARGIKVITKANTKAIVGNGKVEGVELADGTVIPATLVVMAVGIRPNIGLAKEAGLDVNRGIVVDDQHADLGPVHPGAWRVRRSRRQCLRAGRAALRDGARRGRRPVRRRRPRTSSIPTRRPSSRSPASISIRSAISPTATTARRSSCATPRAGIYKRVVLQDNRIIGTVLFGETGDGAWFNDLKKKQTDISEMRDTLIFGQSFQGGVAAGPFGGRCGTGG